MIREHFTTSVNPTLPRKISRENLDFEKIVGDAFYNLVRSISSRYPKVVIDRGKGEKPPLELTKSEKHIIGFLNRSTYPQELIEIMFKNPPSVFAMMDDNPQNTVIPLRPPGIITVTTSPKPDLEMAITPIKIPKNLGEMQVQALDLIVKACQNYLRAPKINDGFSEKDLNRRGLWVLGISNVLKLMTEDKSNKNFFTKKAHYDWETYFHEVWNNNRYAGAKRDAVYMNLPLISLISFPENIHQELANILNTLQKTKATFKSGHIDSATDTIAEQCKRVLSIFT